MIKNDGGASPSIFKKLNHEVSVPDVFLNNILAEKVSPSDFFAFWSNIQFPTFLNQFLKKVSIYPTKFRSENFSLFLYLTLSPSSLKSNLSLYNIIIRGSDDKISELMDCVISNPPNYPKFFELWQNKENVDSFIPIISAISYPIFIQNDDPLIALNSLEDVKFDFSNILLHYSFLFRSFPSNILSPFIDRILTKYKMFPKIEYQRIRAILQSEKIIPFSTAALYEFNVVNCTGCPHILAVPFQMSSSFQISVSSKVHEYNSIYSLLDHIYALHFPEENISPNPSLINELFTNLVNSCRAAYLDERYDPFELWSFFKSNSVERTAPPNEFIPLMLQFEPAEVSHSINLTPSKVLYRGVPLVDTNLSTVFENLISFDGGPSKTKPNMYAAIIGGPIEFMNFIIGYTNFVISTTNFEFKRIFSVIPILGGESRFSKFLNESDKWIRDNCFTGIKLLNQLYPTVNAFNTTTVLDPLIDSSVQNLPNDLWRNPLTPFTIFERFLSFYCECAQFVTKFPIWAAFIIKSDGSKFAIPFIDSVTFSQKPFNGTIKCIRCSPFGDQTGDMDTWTEQTAIANINIYNHSLQSQSEYLNKIEDNSLIFSYDKSHEIESTQKPILVKSKYLVSYFEIILSAKESMTVQIDSVVFSGIQKLRIQRMKHPSTGASLYLPVRHFQSFDKDFDE